jgi:nucleoside phosphorylase
VNSRGVARIVPARLVLLVLLASTVALGGATAASPTDPAAQPPPAPSTAGIVVVLVSANAETVLVSADRDLVPAEIAGLEAKYGAVAGDWEPGAIAHTCARNGQRVLILRGVSDLVNKETGGEAYGNPAVFQEGTRVVMTSLVRQLPNWLARVR